MFGMKVVDAVQAAEVRSVAPDPIARRRGRRDTAERRRSRKQAYEQMLVGQLLDGSALEKLERIEEAAKVL